MVRGYDPASGRLGARFRSAPARLHQAALVGQHDELDPVRDAELHEDPPDVSLDGRLAEVQLVTYSALDKPRTTSPMTSRSRSVSKSRPAGGAMLVISGRVAN